MLRRLFDWLFKSSVHRIEAHIDVKDFNIQVSGEIHLPRKPEVESVSGSSSEKGRGSPNLTTNIPDEDVFGKYRSRGEVKVPEVKFGQESDSGEEHKHA